RCPMTIQGWPPWQGLAEMLTRGCVFDQELWLASYSAPMVGSTILRSRKKHSKPSSYESAIGTEPNTPRLQGESNAARNVTKNVTITVTMSVTITKERNQN